MSELDRVRRCFIIGPMGDANLGDQARLRRLANTIIRPLITEFDSRYDVQTPYDLHGSGLIMNAVINAIDRADVVIADLTGNNPNVFYELAVCHALGVATLAVREADDKLPPFDIRAFKHVDIEIDNAQAACDKIRAELAHIHAQLSGWTVFENPITIFYHEPITNISPAAGIALGYYKNLIEPTVHGIMTVNGDETEYLYDIQIGGEWFGKSLKDRKHLKLQLIIPEKLEFSTEGRLSLVKRELKEVVIPSKKRKVFLLGRYEQDVLCLVDIPSAMNVMLDSIDKRAKQLRINREALEWRDIERDEVNRFHMELKQWIDANDPEFKRRARIVRYDHTIVSSELSWLRDIWVD